MNHEEYNLLESQMKILQRQGDQAEGELKGLLSRLKRDFEVKDLDTAEKVKEAMEEDKKSAEKQWKKSFGEFESKWRSKLEGVR